MATRMETTKSEDVVRTDRNSRGSRNFDRNQAWFNLSRRRMRDRVSYNIQVDDGIAPLEELRRYEYHRLASFFKRDKFGNFPWTSHFVSPLDLAKSGFYYTGMGDAVTCYWCRVTIIDWIPTDDPIHQHKLYGGEECPFIWKYTPNWKPNVPIEVPSESEVSTEPIPSTSKAETTHTTTNADQISTKMGDVVDSFQALSFASKWKVVQFNTEQHNDFAPRMELRRYEYHRLKSFFNRDQYGNLPWTSHFVSPMELAKLGFFYTGRNDSVSCHWCNVTLCDWIPGDDPEVEHKGYADRCPLMSGRPYGISNVPIPVPVVDEEYKFKTLM